MKILQVNNYHYLRGGSERVYLDTSTLLERAGHTVIHFSINDGSTVNFPTSSSFPSGKDGIAGSFLQNIKRVFQYFYSFESKMKLETLLIANKPDIAHLHIFYGRLSSSILPVLKKYKIPVVMTVHEYRMLCPISVLMDREKSICEKCSNGNYIHCILKCCNRNSIGYSSLSALECFVRDTLFSYPVFINHFIMVSRFILDKHLQFSKIEQSKMTVLHNFCNTIAEYPTSSEEYYLYFGRLSREKGLHTLLQCWATLPKLQLIIAGEGPILQELIAQKAKYSLSNIQFVGFQSDEPLRDLIRKAKFSICPSEWYENNPLSIIESIAVGTPVIGANIGGIPEIVIDATTGFLFESGCSQSMGATIRKAESMSADEYLTMQHHAIRVAKEKFSSQFHLHRLLSIYQETIDET